MGLAVRVRNATKSYPGCDGKLVRVLREVNLNVENRSIFGILGPSGCGKTTLLSCIVGIHTSKMDSGNVLVLGHCPGKRGSGIPGPLVGYMPQETALYQIFTIRETLYYYGRISGMQRSEIATRSEKLSQVLQLPKPESLVKNLSGGELRRLSLAAALIHDPLLLVLDEPTIGVDMVLRRSIWEYLKVLVSDGNTSVIITTHYIEEARHCDKVAIMREGRVLAEAEPNFLMHKRGASTLQSVVYDLCREDAENINTTDTSGSKLPNLLITCDNDNVSDNDGWNQVPQLKYTATEWDIVSSLVFKTFLRQIRFLPIFVAQMLLPIVETVICQSIIGVTPRGIKLAYLSHDWNSSQDQTLPEYCMQEYSYNTTCFGHSITPICSFMNQFDIGDVEWVESTSSQSAADLVAAEGVAGILEIPHNYSTNMFIRLIFGRFVDNETIQGSEIKLRTDMSNPLSGAWLMATVLKNFQAFLEEIAVSCGHDRKEAQIPLHFSAIYGNVDDEDGWSINTHPAVIVLFMFILANIGGGVYVMDKRQGLLSRDAVAGVKTRHILMAGILSDAVIMVAQICLFFFMLSTFYNMRMEGSYMLAFALIFLASVAGWALSMMMASLLNHELEVCIPLLCLNITNVLNSGAVWPVEAMPYWFRQFSYTLPITATINGLRNIMFRGWGLSHPSVLMGFVIPIVWIIVCTFVFVRWRKT